MTGVEGVGEPPSGTGRYCIRLSRVFTSAVSWLMLRQAHRRWTRRDADKQIVDYLNTAADEISKRVNALTVDAGPI